MFIDWLRFFWFLIAGEFFSEADLVVGVKCCSEICKVEKIAVMNGAALLLIVWRQSSRRAPGERLSHCRVHSRSRVGESRYSAPRLRL